MVIYPRAKNKIPILVAWKLCPYENIWYQV